jgi:hypothetical protein
LKNVMLVDATDERFTLFIHPDESDSPFAVCPLTRDSPHQTVQMNTNV